MSSWFDRLRGRRAAPKSDDHGDRDAPGGPAPVVELLTADSAVAFELDQSGDRLTDLLNAHDTLDAVDAEGQPGTIAVEEILLAFPPPHPGHPQRRLHRPRRPIRMRVGPYRVEGQLHVPPGAQAIGYLYRVRPRFAPLTEAVIWSEDPDQIERRAPVVIVNVEAADHIEPIEPELPHEPDASRGSAGSARSGGIADSTGRGGPGDAPAAGTTAEHR